MSSDQRTQSQPTTGLLASLQEALSAGDAIELCTAHLKTHPRDASAHRHLAQAYAVEGQSGQAMNSARRACELAPHDPRSWVDLGRVYALDRQFPEAARCFQEAIDCDSLHADGWHNLGVARRKLKDRGRAFDAFKRALLIDATRAETYLELGALLIETAQLEDAIECFERAAQHAPHLARARRRIAQELAARGKVRRAESLFRESLGMDAADTQSWFGLGRALEDLGEQSGAIDCYLNVLTREPHHAEATGQYLALVKEEPEPSVLATAQSAVRDMTIGNEQRALVGYGLAKFYDRRGQYTEASEAGLLANASRRRSSGALDRNALAARVNGITQLYTRDFFAKRRRYGLGNDQPVFVVGLPRSGTTLTEQILASHPLLHGAGELPDIARIAARCAEKSAPWRAAQLIEESQSRVQASAYMEVLRAGAPKRRLRIVDKSPLNFFHLAFIALLFPNARVLHCTRDLRDNALSIWMENFNSQQRYATDFGDLAFFATEYQRLMAHWREHLPLQMLDVRYEDTVADVEAQARRLLDFLDAPWDIRCLDFHRHERAVQTPSRWQVRKPVYANSVGRWRNYASHLPELESEFR